MSIDVSCPLPHNWTKKLCFLSPTFLRDIFGFCILSPQIRIFEKKLSREIHWMKEF